MDVIEFRKRIQAGIKLSVKDKEFMVKEVVTFRFDDGSYYTKCFLSEGYVLADDLSENMFVLVKELSTPFEQPFPKGLDFNGKRFEFLYTAHAVAEKIEGAELFKKGDSERFWDYQSDDNSYLSLGINDNTGQRQDFYGRIIENDTLRAI